MIDYPQVALDFMNRDHAEFIAIRGKLLDLLKQNPPTNEVDDQLDQLLEHTRHHFGEEERRMQEAQFPPYPMHKMEHDRVLEDMQARVTQWQQQRDAAALQNYLEHALADWFTHHVGMMDFVTARYISSQAG
ncbi:MAG TPA: hemerythrin family protein [Gallionella sp.]